MDNKLVKIGMEFGKAAILIGVSYIISSFGYGNLKSGMRGLDKMQAQQRNAAHKAAQKSS